MNLKQLSHAEAPSAAAAATTCLERRTRARAREVGQGARLRAQSTQAQARICQALPVRQVARPASGQLSACELAHARSLRVRASTAVVALEGSHWSANELQAAGRPASAHD